MLRHALSLPLILWGACAMVVLVLQGKQFGGFCALFTLFEGGLSLMRGVEDKWNPVSGGGSSSRAVTAGRT